MKDQMKNRRRPPAAHLIGSIVVDGVEYEPKGNTTNLHCNGCVALGGLKAAIARGDDLEETLCGKLGSGCVRGCFIWVRKSNENGELRLEGE